MGFCTSFKHIQVENMLKTAQRFLPSIKISMALTVKKLAIEMPTKLQMRSITLKQSQKMQKVDLSRHKSKVAQNNETLEVK